MTAPKASDDDTFVVALLHRHLKEQLRATGRGTEYDEGKRDVLLEALGFLDGVSGGRYASSPDGVE